MKKILILLGAGTAIPWGAPTTECITKKIINSGKFINNHEIKIGEFIYNELKMHIQVAPELTEKSINFESIINVVEILINNLAKANLILGNGFLEIKPLVENIFNEEYLYNWQKNNEFEGFEKQFILQSIHNEFYNNVKIAIEKYIPNFTNEKNIYNQFLRNLISSLQEEYFLRIYTLNYDNMFPAICTDNSHFFNGFFEKPDRNTKKFKPDISGIITRRNENCFFNLHGSIYYSFWEPDETIEDIPDYYCLCNEPYNFGDPNQSFKNGILFTPFITGFNKIQKTSFEPFKAFSTSFYLDCLDADVVLVIGYSFSDDYINSVLKNSTILKKSHIVIIGSNCENVSEINDKVQNIYNKIYSTGNAPIKRDEFSKKIGLHDYSFSYLPIGFEQFLTNWEQYKNEFHFEK